MDPLLVARLQGHRPVFVFAAIRGPVWDPVAVAEGFTVWADGHRFDLHARDAVHLANLWSRLHLYAFDAVPLQFFWMHSRLLPASYVNARALLDFAGAVVEATEWQTGLLSLVDIRDPMPAVADLHQRFTTPGEGGETKRYGPYLQQYLQARNLLDLSTAEGYLLGDDTVHPVWTIPALPGRITTKNPPLHSVSKVVRDGWAARKGKRWVYVTWPNVASRIAQMVCQQAPTPLPAYADYYLGAHGVPTPPLDEVNPSEHVMVQALASLWVRTRSDTPYPLPVPWLPPGEPVSIGKLALGATCAFTVSQLAVLAQSRRVRELYGLSDVVPYMGALAFQIDDRIPLPALASHLRRMHGFHVTPQATIGVTRGQMYPLDEPLSAVALDLDKPGEWPVVCPICNGRADCARDLRQHYVEDHPQEVPPS